jgi:hypothetical protein
VPLPTFSPESAAEEQEGETAVRRKSIYPHKSLRYMPFHASFLMQGLAVAVIVDLLLYWQLGTILDWHTQALKRLLEFAGVLWTEGRTLEVLPGVFANLARTGYYSYDADPMFPWYAFGIVAILYLLGYRFMSQPLRPLLFLIPAGLGITLFFLKVVSPELPYSAEDFAAIWYRGESYLWLLMPWIFGLGLFTLNVPFALKLPWLIAVFLYSMVWSVVRLAVALATFHYFGALFMPVFYFIFGFLADFLYIVAIYSLAMDRAAGFLSKQREVWQS